MLKSENRLKKRKEFAYLYKNGLAKHSKNLTLVYLPTKNRIKKIGFSIGKKVGKAHERNFVKRRLSAIVRKFLPNIPDNFNIVFIPKDTAKTENYQILEEEVMLLFTKAGMWNDSK